MLSVMGQDYLYESLDFELRTLEGKLNEGRYLKHATK